MFENPLLETKSELKNVPPDWYTPPDMIEVMTYEQLREFVSVLNERIARLYLTVSRPNEAKVLPQNNDNQ